MKKSIFGEPVGVIVADVDMVTGEQTLATDKEVTTYTLISLARFSAQLDAERFHHELCDREDVDNVWYGRKCYSNESDDTIFATIMWHEYSNGEQPNGSDPNRGRYYYIATAKQLEKMALNQ